MKKILMLVGCLVACSAGDDPGSPTAGSPPAAPAAWVPLIAEYADMSDTVSLLEDGGDLVLLPWHGSASTVNPADGGEFTTNGGARVVFVRDEAGRIEGISLDDRVYGRLNLGAQDGGTFRIEPLLGPEELMSRALAASPPVEDAVFRPSDLVELVSLDSTIALDVRYATTNNFMGQVFYSEPRAFLQRPAAEAVVRANRWLRNRGYGLLVHDGYRPWYVTKMFWDATPEELRIFVADPASGSRHNRGCAIDLTLFDLETGEPVLMTGGYDEMSVRSFPDYPGGTSRQRWHRELLREAMEAQGFSVYEAEWWHFDYRDWQSYSLGNERFEALGIQ
jgi:D-alanyl-D-alanine dipeptidase